MPDITTGNTLAMNQGLAPLVGYNYMLRVEALFDLPCKSVRAFTRELEYDIIQEGGLNDYVHMRRKGVTKPFTLEIERFVGVDYIDPLPLGTDLMLPMVLLVSRYPGYFVPFMVARTYTFTGCTVTKKTFGDLVGDSSSLLVETTTIAYREMLTVDIPWSQAGMNVSPDNSQEITKKHDSSALQRLKDDTQSLLETAKAAAEKAAETDKLYDALVTELQTVNTSIKEIKPKLEKALEAQYKEIAKFKTAVDQGAVDRKAVVDEQNAEFVKQKQLEREEKKAGDALDKDSTNDALKTQLEAAGDKVKEGIEKAAEIQTRLDEAQKKVDAAVKEQKAVNERARGLENLNAALPGMLKELSTAVGAADTRVTEGKEAVTASKESYDKAKTSASALESLNNLSEAQPLAQKVREDTRTCTDKAAIAERTHEFLSTKVTKATAMLELATSLEVA